MKYICLILLCVMQTSYAMQLQQKDRHCLLCYAEDNLGRIPCVNNHPAHYAICGQCRARHVQLGERCWVCRSELVVNTFEEWVRSLLPNPSNRDCLDDCPVLVKFCLFTICGVCVFAHMYYTYICRCS